MGPTSESSAGAELEDFEMPSAVAMAPSATVLLEAAHVIHFMSSDDWEQFILEYVLGMQIESAYVQVKRLGGTGDLGIDIAAFKSVNGLEGPWDCYQCKHYSRALTEADIWPELLKLFGHVARGHYLMPDRYLFLAPKGCGTSLNRLLSSPSKLKANFQTWLQPSATFKLLAPDVQVKVNELVEVTDFNMFSAVQLHEVVATHKRTAYHSSRFGAPLPTRPPTAPPPEYLVDNEARYIEQLIDVYREEYLEEGLDAKVIASGSHPAGAHFQRQRVAFYSAESLRVFARDSVPPGTFEVLQGEIHSAVIDIADAAHPTGRARLDAVLHCARTVPINHVLMQVSRLDDKSGICHQLANEDKLLWRGPR